MPIKRPQLVNDEIYHIVLRGIDGRLIFQGNSDYYRAVHDLFEFNDVMAAPSAYRQRLNRNEDRPRYIGDKRKARKLLVEILAFCLMPNHIHLLLRQKRDGGISQFMKKFGTGYVVYFNQKYERAGHLFQGRFRAVYIKTNEQLKTVFVYIHTNPAALIDPSWKEGGIKKPKEVIEFIENYKWSSYPDYLGKQNFPSVTQRDFFNEIMEQNEWQKYINEWIEYKRMTGWDKSAELE